jgi:hypothetical protein
MWCLHTIAAVRSPWLSHLTVIGASEGVFMVIVRDGLTLNGAGPRESVSRWGAPARGRRRPMQFTGAGDARRHRIALRFAARRKPSHLKEL